MSANEKSPSTIIAIFLSEILKVITNVLRYSFVSNKLLSLITLKNGNIDAMPINSNNAIKITIPITKIAFFRSEGSSIRKVFVKVLIFLPYILTSLGNRIFIIISISIFNNH